MRIKAETKIFRENRAAAIATRKAKLQVRMRLHNVLVTFRNLPFAFYQLAGHFMCGTLTGNFT